MNLFKMGVCIAWAALAISSATPATATVLTNQNGDYAACSADTSTQYQLWTACQMETSYIQTIRFISTSCGAGGCNDGNGMTYSEFEYDPGRKTTNYLGACTLNIYGLGSCAC
jgi:hypothetical protein